MKVSNAKLFSKNLFHQLNYLMDIACIMRMCSFLHYNKILCIRDNNWQVLANFLRDYTWLDLTLFFHWAYRVLNNFNKEITSTNSLFINIWMVNLIYKTNSKKFIWICTWQLHLYSTHTSYSIIRNWQE